jgi:mevalonate pyrophosphate decarboxylase
MTKISSLLQKCKSIENSLLEMEIRMIITLINAGIKKETATSIVKKTIQESNYFMQLKSLEQEIEDIKLSEGE